jgi:hypothetical protein
MRKYTRPDYIYNQKNAEAILELIKAGWIEIRPDEKRQCFTMWPSKESFKKENDMNNVFHAASKQGMSEEQERALSQAEAAEDAIVEMLLKRC